MYKIEIIQVQHCETHEEINPSSMKHQLNCYLLVMLCFISGNLEPAFCSKENMPLHYEEIQDKFHYSSKASANYLFNCLREQKRLENTTLPYSISNNALEQTRMTNSRLHTYGDIIEVMNHRIITENISFLDSTIIHYTRICQVEKVPVLIHVKKLNIAWENVQKYPYKESVKKREYYDYAEESKV